MAARISAAATADRELVIVRVFDAPRRLAERLTFVDLRSAKFFPEALDMSLCWRYISPIS